MFAVRKEIENRLNKMIGHFQKQIKNAATISLGVAVATALVILSVLPFYVSAGYHDTQRLISTLIVAVGLCGSIWFARVSRHTMWLIGGTYSWGMVSVCMSPLPLWSMLEFGLLFSVVLMGVTFLSKLQNLQLKFLAVLIATIHAYYVVHNVMEYAFTLLLGGTLEPYAMSNGFSNVRFYGQFLVWTVPFLVGVMVTNPKMPYRFVFSGLLMFDWAFEFLTLTRAFLVAMTFTPLMVWWVAKEYWLRYTKCLFFTASVGFVIYVFMLFLIPSLLGLDVSHAIRFSSGRDMLSSSGRVHLWQDTWAVILNHPLLGAGPMMTALTSVSNISAHPHNFILQLLAEWGIPFTLILFGGTVFGLVRLKNLIALASTDSLLLALPIMASLSAGAIAGLFDGLLVMPVSLVYMALFIICCVGLWRALTPEVRRVIFPRWTVPVLLFPSIFVAVFSVINWPHWSAKNAIEIPKPMSGNGYKLSPDRNPRFWLTGQIEIVKK
jgi:putative inorganic carbon (hco3(-)) transporter